MKQCERCGTPFKGQRSSSRFCSIVCANTRNWKSPRDRLFDKVDKNGPVPQHRAELGPCWDWTAARLSSGYGLFLLNKVQTTAHRAAWILTYGAIGDGLQVMHKCDRPSCVNPEHLELGTQLDNMRDMVRKGRSAKTRGEQKWSAKVCSCAVRAMRILWQEGVSQKEIAKRFGVDCSSVSKTVRGRQWKHVA
jgi:hypothetical protein